MPSRVSSSSQRAEVRLALPGPAAPAPVRPLGGGRDGRGRSQRRRWGSWLGPPGPVDGVEDLRGDDPGHLRAHLDRSHRERQEARGVRVNADCAAQSIAHRHDGGGERLDLNVEPCDAAATRAGLAACGTSHIVNASAAARADTRVYGSDRGASVMGLSLPQPPA